MNTGMKNGTSDQTVFSSIDRKAPPTTELLQQRILVETECMPQHSPVLEGVKTPSKHVQVRRLGWRLLPTAGIAVVIFSVALGVSNLLPKQPEIIEISVNHAPFTASDELAWQDVMLMHDELAFIDL